MDDSQKYAVLHLFEENKVVDVYFSLGDKPLRKSNYLGVSDRTYLSDIAFPPAREDLPAEYLTGRNICFTALRALPSFKLDSIAQFRAFNYLSLADYTTFHNHLLSFRWMSTISEGHST